MAAMNRKTQAEAATEPGKCAARDPPRSFQTAWGKESFWRIEIGKAGFQAVMQKLNSVYPESTVQRMSVQILGWILCNCQDNGGGAVSLAFLSHSIYQVKSLCPVNAVLTISRRMALLV